jgi:predicted dehydrogenase
MPANALVVGYGRMGRFHKTVLEDLGYTVTTVDPAGHADHDTVKYWTWDAAAVATPVHELAPITRRLLLADTPTLVEKPVAMTVTEVKRLRITQLQAGTPCAVGFVERFNPTITDLKDNLGSGTSATFTRINDRPSWNTRLDLQLHDVDLALYLGLDPAACTFHTQADANMKVRRIDTPEHSVDLTAHTRSPLHHLWRAFMRGDDHPTLTDAVNAHQALDRLTTLPIAA